MVLGDSREGLESCFDLEDEEEEELLRQAIALSLEGAAKNDSEHMGEEGLHFVHEDEEEEEKLLKQAIALSLEGVAENI